SNGGMRGGQSTHHLDLPLTFSRTPTIRHSQIRSHAMSNSSSFSNVVSSLVRAQMGSSVTASTLDEELDRRVAELILKEARQKEERNGNAAKTNKRFLASIIKSTDEHNKTVLRAQAEAASEVKQQRERQEREERMRRAQEAVAARTGTSSSSYRGDSWDS
ncbi:12167_t:CDS:2, partial [Acaulospora colombiana]